MPRISILTPLAAAAVLLGTSLAAQAQSSVKVYGLMDLNVGRFQLAGAKKTYQVSNGDMSTSFLGFSGKEDLGGGMSAKFAIESFLRPDTGKSGRVAIDAGTNTDVFWARAANVGLSSSAGTVTLGRSTTTMFISTLIFNPFGDSFGFSPSIRQYYTKELIGDSGWSNSVTYNSPNFSGFSAALQGNLGEGATGAKGKNLGGNVLYFGGPFAATAAYQDVKNSSDVRFGSQYPTGFVDQTAYQLGGSYDLGPVKGFLQYGKVTTNATVKVTAKISQIGLSAPVAGGAVLASYGYDKRTTGAVASNSKITSLGYDYNLSKNTDLYAVYMRDAVTGLTNGTTMAAGIRLKF